MALSSLQHPIISQCETPDITDNNTTAGTLKLNMQDLWMKPLLALKI